MPSRETIQANRIGNDNVIPSLRNKQIYYFGGSDNTMSSLSSASPVIVRLAATENLTCLFGIQTIDNVLGCDSNAILLSCQSNTTENGLYTMTGEGLWYRSGTLQPGCPVYVSEGQLNCNSRFTLTTTTPFPLGCNPINFNKESQNWQQKITNNDQHEDWLWNKLVPGRDLSKTLLNSGGNEQYKLDAHGLSCLGFGAGILHCVDGSGNTIIWIETDDKFVKVTAGDSTADYLANKLFAGHNITATAIGTIGTPQAMELDSTDKYVAIDAFDDLTCTDYHGDYLAAKLLSCTGLNWRINNGGANENMAVQLYNFTGLTNAAPLLSTDNPVLICQKSLTCLSDIEKITWRDLNWAQIGTDYGQNMVGQILNLTIPKINTFPFTGYYRFNVDILCDGLTSIAQPTIPADTFAFDNIIIYFNDLDGSHVVSNSPAENFTIGQKGNCPTPCCCTVNGSYDVFELHIQGIAHLLADGSFVMVILIPKSMNAFTITFVSWGFNYLCQTLGRWY